MIKMEIIDNVENENKDKFLKEDLERYYIDEGKSMVEISKIYGCSSPTIKNKLKKHRIPVRYYGSFLIDNDGESLYSKYIRNEISYSDYRNEQVKKKGFESWNDYTKKMRHEKGEGLSMSENKECSKYLGVHICENKEFISKIINIVESMQCNNPGYDIICGKGKKIDIKCSCLIYNKEWHFSIKKNKIADYFLMIAFDNRETLNVQHIWLVKSNTYIEKTNNYFSKSFIFNERIAVIVGKGIRALKRWNKYEITDIYKLKEVQKVCNNFKNNV